MSDKEEPKCVEGLEFVGPFEEHRVVLDGWQIPLLQARPLPDGVALSVDGRFGLVVPTDQAHDVIWFIANCIAVAGGYTCHPHADDESPRRANPWPAPRRCAEIGSTQTGATEPSLRLIPEPPSEPHHE